MSKHVDIWEAHEANEEADRTGLPVLTAAMAERFHGRLATTALVYKKEQLALRDRANRWTRPRQLNATTPGGPDEERIRRMLDYDCMSEPATANHFYHQAPPAIDAYAEAKLLFGKSFSTIVFIGSHNDMTDWYADQLSNSTVFSPMVDIKLVNQMRRRTIPMVQAHETQKLRGRQSGKCLVVYTGRIDEDRAMDIYREVNLIFLPQNVYEWPNTHTQELLQRWKPQGRRKP